MTTVIAVYTASRCIGRCDARCHDAATADCDCICGGKNHGIGLMRALENNRGKVGLAPADLVRFAEAHGLRAEELVAIDRLEFRDPERARAMARARLSVRDIANKVPMDDYWERDP